MSVPAPFRDKDGYGGRGVRALLGALEPGGAPKLHATGRSLSKQLRHTMILLEAFEDRVLPSFTLGAAANYAILFEGGGGKGLKITNVMTKVTGSGPSQGGGIGNIGVGGAGKVSLNGPGTINGNLDVAASNTGQVTGNNVTVTGTRNFGVAAVTSALNTVNALNTTLGALPGTRVTISSNTTIAAMNGTFFRFGDRLRQCESLQRNLL